MLLPLTSQLVLSYLFLLRICCISFECCNVKSRYKKTLANSVVTTATFGRGSVFTVTGGELST